MLKRITYILFATLILFSTVGMPITKHYCESALKSISLFSKAKPCCEIPTGCCHDESITLKIQDSFSLENSIIDFSTTSIDLPAVSELFASQSFESFASETISWESPPPRKIQTVLSQLQTYLI